MMRNGIFSGLFFFLFLGGAAFGQRRICFQRQLEVKPLSLLQYSLDIRCRDSAAATAFLRFYDAGHRELLEYKSGPVVAAGPVPTGYYTEAPPDTKYALVTVEADAADTGKITVDGFHAELNIGVPAISRAPACNTDQYLEPFWNTDTVYNETVLLYSRQGGGATGNLLYVPDSILSVRRFDLKTVYTKDKDYRINGNTITRLPQSEMPFRTDSSFEQQNLAWFNLQSQWVVVTYTHHDAWAGPVPGYKGNRMPRTMARLRSRSPLRIVAYGMSITRGLDVSGYDSVAPYMPPYVDLFAGALKKIYGDSAVRLFNAALPGARADWGAQYAGQYVNPLKPDLVIIDFGMNDFWMYKPAAFQGFIQTIIRRVQHANPKAEFLLLSNMKFDPGYVLDSDRNKPFYLENLKGYNTVLQRMEKTGIVNLDMTTLSDFIYRRKNPRDCLTNPLHPNDYMARWYAQGMIALFRQPGS